MNWREIRFALFDRNPDLFAAFQLSLDELHLIVGRYAELKKYDVTLTCSPVSEQIEV